MNGSSLEATVTPSAHEGRGWDDERSHNVWTIGDLVKILFRRKWLLLAITLCGCMFGIAYIIAVTPVYSAGSGVLLRPNNQFVVDLRPVLSTEKPDPFLLDAQINSEIEVIKSYPIISPVIDRLGLMADPEINPAIPSKAGDGYLHPWWYVASFWRLVDDVGTKFRKMRHPEQSNTAEAALNLPPQIREHVFERFLQRLYVGQLGRSMAIVIAYSSADPVKAARIVNAMMQQYLQYDQERKSQATVSATNWLGGQLKELRARQQSLEEAIQSYLATSGLAGDAPEDMAKRIDDVKLQLYRATLDRDVAAKRVETSVTTHGNPNTDPEVLASPLIAQLRTLQGTLTSELRNALTLYGEKNPAVLTARAALDRLGGQIQTEEGKIVEAERQELALAQTRVNTLQAQLIDLEETPGREKTATAKLNEMQREAAANASLYEEFLKRYEEVLQELAVEQKPDAQILHPAWAPTSPAYPQKSFILSASLATAMVLAICVAFALELLKDRFRSVEEIEGLLRRPALGVLPQLLAPEGRRTRPESYLIARPNSPYGEAVRGLRTSILLTSDAQDVKSVMFTSAIPNEGKTTTALSFARMAARVGERVIIVDCDMRRSRRFKAAAGTNNGLSDILRGLADPRSVIKSDSATPLHFITAGTAHEAPADLLERPEMRQLMVQLVSSYDLVVIDTPPVLSVADAQRLARLVQETVLVVEWARTSPKDVKKAFDVLLRAGASVLGVAVSKADRSMLAKYDYETNARETRGEKNLLLGASA